MSLYVPESAVNYEAVFRRGGRNMGDEDFALFKCPNCGHVYLMDYEVDTVFLDGDDLSKRDDLFDESHPFVCSSCEQPMPNGVWVGPHAEERFQVTWLELKASRWSWVATPMRSFGDETQPLHRAD
ncbi:hypothetical protein [Methylibium rhizosphaerae]|uniref:hypothetical protein n=1 Tax=Methylibium rhizosphaerae TaxID=2570323 RepID=UPI00112983F7|nr:hypothetical protein [Methylibium rhizosphaerae]